MMEKQMKKEQSKKRAARRPEIGSWHTITEEAKKLKDGYRVDWYSMPIDHGDWRCGKYVWVGEGESPKTIDYGKGWDWEVRGITSYRAMYIGYRYKKNGKQDIDYEGQLCFITRETVEVWLFVTHENRNPITVFPFDCTDESDGE